MTNRVFKNSLLLLAGMLVLTACAPQRRLPRYEYYDAQNPLKHVAVLPMKNDTTDVDGPNVVRKKMIDALENKSYIVQDVKETDELLRDKMGITLGGQLDMTSAQALGETLGVEGVLYGNLMDFDESTTGVLNVRKVRAKFKLVNTRSSQPLWERGLGIRSETRMAGRTGEVASLVARGSDSREKEVPWVTIESTAVNEKNVGQAFALGLGVKLLTKAIGMHLDRESSELARRVSETLPWGPGPGGRETVAVPSITIPKVRVPEPRPPSFGYLDYGTRDFSALLVSVTVSKSGLETSDMQIPLAKAGDKIRMDMDLSRMSKGSEGMPPALSKITMVHVGGKKMSYTLYPNARKFITHADADDAPTQQEKPLVEKAKVGSEVVNGHSADKYRIKITYKNGTTLEGFQWEARDLGNMTIKSDVQNSEVRTTTELKNIVLKTPAESLFEIPTGYTEAQGILDVMGNAPNR